VRPIGWNGEGRDIGFLLLAGRLTGSAGGLASLPEEPEHQKGDDDDTEDEHHCSVSGRGDGSRTGP